MVKNREGGGHWTKGRLSCLSCLFGTVSTLDTPNHHAPCGRKVVLPFHTPSCLPYASLSILKMAATGTVNKTPSWTDILAAMKRDEDGPAAFASDEGVDVIASEMEQFVDDWTSWKPVVPVTALDINRYTGRWYQVKVDHLHYSLKISI